MKTQIKLLCALVAVLCLMAGVAAFVYKIIIGATIIGLLAILCIVISTYAMSKRW